MNARWPATGLMAGCMLTGAGWPAFGAAGTPDLLARIHALDAAYDAFALCHRDADTGEVVFVYGDTKGIVHHVVAAAGHLHENWRSFPLETPIRRLFAEDLDADGRTEIIAHTRGGQIYVWGTDSYDLVWDSLRDGIALDAIQAMDIADVDSDGPLELVLCVANRIIIYDGVDFFREREGPDLLRGPSQLVVGDVDGDGSPEIVTNDGHVLDSRTLAVEWATRDFGYPMMLFDMDGDGVLDVGGETSGALTFWDIRNRREMC